MSDFFVSFAQQDKHWAEWIAWTLESSGYSVFLPSRDFTPGQNLVLEMHQAVSASKRMILILSTAYVESRFVQADWAAAVASDPTGQQRRVIPVRVQPVEPTGLLSTIVYVDLFGKSEGEARNALLAAIQPDRARPEMAPSFPSATHVSVPYEPLSYPGWSAVQDPPELIPYIEHFRRIHPDPRKNAFIMMRFGESRSHQAIAHAIRDSLATHGVAALRADDNTFAEYLMSNVRTYMHGCGFGVAVFERIESESHNPNIALEVGYMLALGKRVCLLKDKSLKQLPTDMVGSLYSEFDLEDIGDSVRAALNRWLHQRGLAKH